MTVSYTHLDVYKRQDSVFFTVLGMLIGLLLSHGLIQIIYEFDIHSVLNKKWHILAAGAAAAAIFSAVYFDFTGYDTYIPETDEIASVDVYKRQAQIPSAGSKGKPAAL